MLFAALDLNTTGLRPNKHEIIQIGLTVVRYPAGTMTLSWESLFSASIDNDAWEPKAIEYHGVTQRDVVGLPRFTSCIPVLKNFLTDVSAIVGHNVVQFDKAFLAQTGFPVDKYVWVDTMKDLPRIGKGWPNLHDAAQWYGIQTPVDLHSALRSAKISMDIAVCSGLLEKIRKELIVSSAHQVKDTL